MYPFGHMVSDMYSKWTTTGLAITAATTGLAITAAVRRTNRPGRSGMVLFSLVKHITSSSSFARDEGTAPNVTASNC